MSNSLQPHGLQQSKLPCSSLSPSICSDSCPLSRWCHPTISSSISSFSSYPEFFPVSGSFPTSQLFRWPKYWNFSFSIHPSSEHSGLIFFRIDWFDLAIQGTLKRLLQHHSLKFLVLSLLHVPTLTSIHDYWKNNSFDYIAMCWLIFGFSILFHWSVVCFNYYSIAT